MNPSDETSRESSSLEASDTGFVPPAGASVTARVSRFFAAKALPDQELDLSRLSPGTAADAPTLLLEMRPALDGFAGIPQETRLLFRGLSMIDGVKVEGMIQTSGRRLAPGLSLRKKRRFGMRLSEARQINRYSRVVISLADKPFRTVVDSMLDYLERRLQSNLLSAGTLMGVKKVTLSGFRSRYFEDFIWRTMFSKTLPASDFKLISGSDQRVCPVPWSTMHVAGLKTLNFLPSPMYPVLDTQGIDIFLGQTPYPGRVSHGTAMVIRYHDAIPVFMPHTIPDKSSHQATHFYALMSNVRNGAWFACVSEATRQDLLRLFPEAAPRAVTIHNMVSHHYFPEESERALVPGIIRSRLYEGDPTKGVEFKPKFLGIREQEAFYRKHLAEKPFRYLLIVSTLEPRKNHARLLAAWEVLKAEVDPDLKLVVVGTLGWDFKALVESFKPWISRGDLFALAAVPAPDLRVLYKHAAATVCPSLGEGFDFSGVESMRSGGVVIASDIPVHREVYEDASEYFDPYATSSLVRALRKVIYAADADGVQADLRARGSEVSARYLPDRILPQWGAFIDRVLASAGGRARTTAKPPAAIDRQGASTLRPEDVAAAFRELLGRDPESEQVIEEHLSHGNAAALRAVIMSSAEFQARFAALAKAVAATAGEGAATHPAAPAGEPARAGSRAAEAAATDLASIGRDDVLNAFQELLGRQPESEAVIEAHLAHQTPDRLREAIRSSPEFASRRPGSARWVRTDVLDGKAIWVDLNDRFVSHGCLQGSWEPEETAFLRATVKAGQTVLDIGANVGWYSLVAAECVGEHGRVHAFEPRPETARMLRRTIADNGLDGRIAVWEVALDDRPGERRLVWNPVDANPGHSWLAAAGSAQESAGAPLASATVNSGALDALLPELRADFVKIDVEGAEPRVIAGAAGFLARCRPTILSELFPAQLVAVSGVTAADFIRQMEALGYGCYLLENGRPGRRLRDFPADATRELVSVVFDSFLTRR